MENKKTNKKNMNKLIKQLVNPVKTGKNPETSELSINRGQSHARYGLFLYFIAI